MTKQPVQVPKLGMDTTEAIVAEWLVAAGDKVSKGTGLVELESEKVNFVVESEYEGTLTEILAPVGSTVPVGGTIAWVAGE